MLVLTPLVALECSGYTHFSFFSDFLVTERKERVDVYLKKNNAATKIMSIMSPHRTQTIYSLHVITKKLEKLYQAKIISRETKTIIYAEIMYVVINLIYNVEEWCECKGTELVTEKLWVQLRAIQPSSNDSGQTVHTRVPVPPSIRI